MYVFCMGWGVNDVRRLRRGIWKFIILEQALKGTVKKNLKNTGQNIFEK